MKDILQSKVGFGHVLIAIFGMVVFLLVLSPRIFNEGVLVAILVVLLIGFVARSVLLRVD